MGRRSRSCVIMTGVRENPFLCRWKVGTGQYTFPNVLSKKPGEEEWHFGLEVEYFVEQQDEIPVENLYTLCLKQETVEVDGATWKVGELLGKFIGNALRILGVPDLVKSINGLMITTPVLTRPMVENIRVACREMGFPRNRCFLQDYEENLSHLEEELLEGNMEDFDRKILLSRKELSVLSAYYEQLSDMGETLQQNAARHQTEQEALLFGLFCEKAGRLYDMVQTLKEYSMQLREMHQTQIDIRQNEIMKVLTIVTTLFYAVDADCRMVRNEFCTYARTDCTGRVRDHLCCVSASYCSGNLDF